jgi:hypothetical protein
MCVDVNFLYTTKGKAFNCCLSRKKIINLRLKSFFMITSKNFFLWSTELSKKFYVLIAWDERRNWMKSSGRKSLFDIKKQIGDELTASWIACAVGTPTTRCNLLCCAERINNVSLLFFYYNSKPIFIFSFMPQRASFRWKGDYFSACWWFIFWLKTHKLFISLHHAHFI